MTFSAPLGLGSASVRVPAALRTGWVVVRRTVRVSSGSSMIGVVSLTHTLMIARAWMRPRATHHTVMGPDLPARDALRV